MPPKIAKKEDKSKSVDKKDKKGGGITTDDLDDKKQEKDKKGNDKGEDAEKSKPM